MIILGIDPGTAATGYGIIAASKHEIRALSYGCISTEKGKTAAERLDEIYSDLEKLIKKHKPQKAAVESLFFFKNVKTAMSVAQARGVVLLCLQRNSIPTIELTPLQVKQGLTSYGKADKKQIQYMVKQILRLKKIPRPDDAADALAIAICATNY